jgi:hypothetical protein
MNRQRTPSSLLSPNNEDYEEFSDPFDEPKLSTPRISAPTPISSRNRKRRAPDEFEVGLLSIMKENTSLIKQKHNETMYVAFIY